MARPKLLDEGFNRTFRLDAHTRNMLLALRLEGESSSATLRRVVREFAAAVLGGEGVAP